MEGEPQIGASVTPPPRGSGLAAAGWAALTIVALLALVDLAVETWWSRSPLRWWVSPAALIFVLLSLWLWKPGESTAKRWGWRGAATWGIGGWLLLLAAAAWLSPPAGGAVRMFGRESALVMNLVAAIVVVAAVAGMARARLLPAAGVVTGAAIGLYAVAALVLAWRSGIPFQSSVMGAAFWIRLPMFLQGAFLGAFLILPGSLVLEAVATIRKRTNPWRGPQCVAAALVVAIAAAGWTPATTGPRTTSAVPSGQGAAGSHPPPSSTGFPSGQPAAAAQSAEAMEQARQESRRSLALPTLDASLPETAQTLDASFNAVERLLAQVPRTSFDLSAIVGRVGRDPARLFEWVRDETTWVPYRGELRGPIGVLMDRLGNSLDRALLLCALLEKAGSRTRLAHGTLTASQVDALVAAHRSARPAPAATDNEAAVLDILLKAPGVRLADADAVRSALDLRRDASRRLANDLRAAAEAQAALLLASLPAGGATANGPDREAAADHWWVQLERNKEWIDLDPSLPDASPGATLTATSETRDRRAIGASLQHQVVVRVVIEQLAAGRVIERVALEERLAAADVIGVPVAVVHVPQNPEPLVDILGRDPSARAVVQSVQGEQVWQPVLVVGKRTVTQRAFRMTGDLVAPDSGGSAELQREAAPAQPGMLSGVLGGGDNANAAPVQGQPAADAQLTAEWIEYDVDAPGRSPTRTRRQVFDLIGPGARRGDIPASYRLSDANRTQRILGLLTSTELAIVACGLTPEFLAWQRAEALLAGRKLLAGLARQPQGAAADRRYPDLAGLVPPPGPEFDLAVARHLWSPVATDVYLAVPNVIALHKGFSGDSLEALKAFVAFDVVRNDVAVHERAASQASQLRLRSGTFDWIAEHLLLRDSCCSAPGGGAGDTAPGDLSRGRWMAARSVSDLKDLQLDADSEARIAADLAAGYLVVAPAAAAGPAPAWWRIDPGTGSTLAIGSRGWGQGFVEHYVVRSYQQHGGMYFAVEMVKALVCFGFTAIQAVRHQNPYSFAGGVVLCTIASAHGFAGAATTAHGVHTAAVGLEALHYYIEGLLEAISWGGGHHE